MQKIICIIAILSLWPCGPALALGDAKNTANTKEYFTTNRDGRLLIKVQIWGNVYLTGTHYLPDNCNLLDALGYAGGPQGPLSRATILVRRGEQSQVHEGREILENPTLSKYLLKPDDIVYVEIEQDKDTLVRSLGVVSAITGIVSSSLAIYLVVSQNRK